MFYICSLFRWGASHVRTRFFHPHESKSNWGNPDLSVLDDRRGPVPACRSGCCRLRGATGSPKPSRRRVRRRTTCCRQCWQAGAPAAALSRLRAARPCLSRQARPAHEPLAGQSGPRRTVKTASESSVTVRIAGSAALHTGPVLVDDRLDRALHVGSHLLDEYDLVGGQKLDVANDPPDG
jgi:hypothetical protein